jgi:hypothetical protein
MSRKGSKIKVGIGLKNRLKGSSKVPLKYLGTLIEPIEIPSFSIVKV